MPAPLFRHVVDERREHGGLHQGVVRSGRRLRRAGKLAAVNSPFTPAMAKTVADVCMACKKECDKFPQYVECTDCGTACKACAEECRKTMG